MPHTANDHVTIDPAILYFGTPVVLVSTSNPEGAANLAPMSSAWWLGRSPESAYRPKHAAPPPFVRTRDMAGAAS